MSSQVVTPNTEAAILARILIESDEAQLSPDAARYLLSVKLPPKDADRVNELSAKARAGTLTESERQELDSYLHIGSLLAVMQSKARRLLKTRPLS
ncbi:MAG: hypothetical protein JOZ48_20545 [Acidobacteriaceae bacterium]|nr:hypothetical protein [Acidobacteriaceae bacterium]